MNSADYSRISRVSPPARAAWIETLAVRLDLAPMLESPPARAAWIETASRCHVLAGFAVSPPARAAWIETLTSRPAYARFRCRRPRGRRGLKLSFEGSMLHVA